MEKYVNYVTILPELIVSVFGVVVMIYDAYTGGRKRKEMALFSLIGLIGAGARPWLPGAFCAAASLPHLHPERRRALLQSISEAAATAPGWSSREPTFYPEWVEKIDIDKQPN